MDIHKALKFFEKLDKHNSKKWMDVHRSEWHTVRDWWVEVVSKIVERGLEHDPDLWTLNPKKSITRINSDIRFSKNKRLYKTYVGARFNPESTIKGDSGYYIDFGIKREMVFYCGAWAVGQRDWQRAIRKKITMHGEVLREIISDKELQAYFPNGMVSPQLKRPPRGYSKDEEFIELLKYTSWALGKRWKLTDTITEEEYIDMVVDHIRVTSDFVRYFRVRNLPLLGKDE